MKFSLSWLRDYLDTDASVSQIAETLTALGLEVELIQDPAVQLAPFRMAFIEEAVPHPQADRLRVCTVFTGSERLQIVCGAPNARAGIAVVMAPIGAVIPANGLVIKKSAIRGVESNGMLCSSAELGLSAEGEGILEFAAPREVAGTSFVEFARLNDPVIEIAVTPNRADALGIYGIARDLAAAGLGVLKPITVPAISVSLPAPSAVVIEDANACPLFLGRVIRGVKNGESPEWLKARLKAIGVRPISALVDISNYLCHAFARPSHVYDLAKLSGALTVRYARAGESFSALDHQHYVLTKDIVVVADAQAPQAIAGVIGGADSGCSLATRDVFLEVALFDPIRVTQSGRAFSIQSDARYRFERGVDPESARVGMDLLTSMILELCGGEASEVAVSGGAPVSREMISFAPHYVEQLGGVALDPARVRSILSALGFVCEGEGAVWQIRVPSWRADVSGSHDLVEEVLRVHGYSHIPTTPLSVVQTSVVESALRSRTRLARQTMIGLGAMEVVTWSFMDKEKAKHFGELQSRMEVANPISQDLNYLRPSVIPNLLDAVKRNADRGFFDVALFEAGPVFCEAKPYGERSVVSVVRAGEAIPRHVHGAARNVDLFDAKADLYAMGEACGLSLDSLPITAEPMPGYHPGRVGVIRLGKQLLGVFGEIHPAVRASFDVEKNTVAAELFLDALPDPKARKGTARSLPKFSEYQASVRDFAFVVDVSLPAAELLKIVRKTEKQLITDIRLFDAYQGKGMEPGKKSLAFSIRLQADHTLSEAELSDVSNRVIAAVEKECGGVLRG